MTNMDGLTSNINRLTPQELRYICKLLCFMRFCPGFSEDMKQIIPAGCETASPAQIAATNKLMDKWLYAEGWAEILRPELESVGVEV